MMIESTIELYSQTRFSHLQFHLIAIDIIQPLPYNDLSPGRVGDDVDRTFVLSFILLHTPGNVNP
jgi:hypothetical protein